MVNKEAMMRRKSSFRLFSVLSTVCDLTALTMILSVIISCFVPKYNQGLLSPAQSYAQELLSKGAEVDYLLRRSIMVGIKHCKWVLPWLKRIFVSSYCEPRFFLCLHADYCIDIQFL